MRRSLTVGRTAAAMLSATVLLVLLLCMGGCGDEAVDGADGVDAGGDQTESVTLDGTVWRLMRWRETTINPRDFTITATFADGRMGGTSAVNTYGGPYTTGPSNDFSLGDLDVTEMAGPDSDMKAEAAYLRLLEDTDGFHLAGNTLTLFGSDGAASLIFNAGLEGDEEAELRDRLTPQQYEVTQHEGTEPAFDNDYWDEHRDGIYVDVVTGDPLFSSRDKYDSGTGWPSFTKPLRDEAVTTRADGKLLGSRTEVRGAASDAHLGHVFSDGPRPTGRRYCMNSAALRFVPREDLQVEGYGDYEGLFGDEEG